jgi:hypothetical protein
MKGRKDSRRTQLLDAQLRQPLSDIDSLVQRLALNQGGHETASEGVSSTVGVVDLLLPNGVDGVLLNLVLALLGDDGGLGALGDDGDAGALGVGLGQVGEVLGDGGDVGLGGQAVRLGVGARLGLVADDVVPVLGRLVQRVLEELGDEWRRHVDDEDLVVCGGLLAQSEDGRGADYWVWSSAYTHSSRT